MVDSAEEAAGLVHHRYTNDSGGLREIARRSAVVDVDNQGEITKVGAGLRPHNGRDGAARSMPVDLPLATSAPTVAMRPPDILPATVTDADDIVRALLAGAGIAYKDLPGAETGGVERLVADMALRWRPRYRERLADGSPGIFVARQDGEFAGFIWASHRSDELIAWHVLPEFHGHKIGSHLMRTALEFLGDVDTYSGTTEGTVAEAAHRRVGFKEDESVPKDHESRKTPEKMVEAGLTAPQIPLVLSRDARRLFLERMRA
ncbi:GNAT family N-acetyltransferase [Nocardia sp. NBC_00403]|uniref:GNAT family N-acetyltransferase n=1 Tax=Nocardia sp. NBC_00403 TaxID=2975990 RepID=UPI002E1E0D88